jgi:hypothetical protein
MRVYNEPERQNVNQAPAQTVLCLRTRGGTVPLSCFQICTPMKVMIRTPKRTKRVIIRPLLQSYRDPPHCKARRTQIMAGRNRKVPRMSNSFSLAFQPRAGPAACPPGLLKKKRMNMAVIRPNGRLI